MGINPPLQQNMQSAGLAGIDRLAGNAMFPQSQMDKTQYAVSSQMPTSAEVVNAGYEPRTNAYTGLPMANFAKGGIARYAEGGTTDPSQWEVGSYNPNPADAEGNIPYFRDPDTGNLYTTNDENRQLIATGEALNNPDIKGLGLEYVDPTKAQTLYDLKSEDPKAYASQAMDLLSKEINTAYQSNLNYDQLWNQFAGLKEQNPQEWYKKQLGFLGGQTGWQIGQNTSERNAAIQPQIENTVAEAKAAGLGDDEINNILSGSQQSANYLNQQRIASLMEAGGSGFNFKKDMLPGLIKVGLAAAAMTGIGALGAGAAAGEGAAIGSGLGAAEGAGAAGAGLGAAEGAGAAGAAGAGGAAAGGAGAGAGAAGTGITGSQALNTARGLMMANSLINQMSGGDTRTGYAGQGVNPYGTVGFNPGTTSTLGLPNVSGYERTPWANLMPGITLSKLSEFAPDRDTKEMASGGKAESKSIFDGLTPREKELIKLELMAQSLARREGEEYSGMPLLQGATGRLGASAQLDENSRIRAGLSGLAMALPGQHGVKTMPGSVDIGYSTQAGPGDLDLSAFRSINAIPGKGYAQGLNARYTIPFAGGGDVGHLGGYSDGGRLLKGPGDGMSDNIPASISDKQPARLADGEFVVPADVVSHLGNGSTDAGAKQLYAMMDKVRQARTGNKKQGKQINPAKFLPKG